MNIKLPIIISIILLANSNVFAAAKIKATVDKDTKELRRQLEFAIYDNNTAKVEELIKAGLDVNFAETKDSYGGTYWIPLVLAAWEDNKGIIELLLKAGADINSTQNTKGETPLITAAYYGKLNALEVLLRAGADIGKRTTWGDAIEHARQITNLWDDEMNNNKKEAVKMLESEPTKRLERIADYNGKIVNMISKAIRDDSRIFPVVTLILEYAPIEKYEDIPLEDKLSLGSNEVTTVDNDGSNDKNEIQRAEKRRRIE